MCIDPSEINKLPKYWEVVLYEFLRVYANTVSCTRGTPRKDCIRETVEGFYLDEDDQDAKDNEEDANGSAEDDEPDLNTSIRIITSIFQSNARLSGNPLEPFVNKLQPILDQMEDSRVPKRHRKTVLFSCMNDKARGTAAKSRVLKSRLISSCQKSRTSCCMNQTS